jgi:hypothetical protein
MIGVSLAIVSILTYTGKFKNLKEFFTAKTYFIFLMKIRYDASFNTKNLANNHSPRAEFFLSILKEKYNT